MTKQKALILRLINESDQHPTAEQVFALAKAEMPAIVRATVYNNLNTLTAEKRIRRITLHGDADRYDSVHVPHEHLICACCGKISDLSLGDLLPELCERTGLELLSYQLNLEYLCPSCRK